VAIAILHTCPSLPQNARACNAYERNLCSTALVAKRSNTTICAHSMLQQPCLLPPPPPPNHQNLTSIRVTASSEPIHTSGLPTELLHQMWMEILTLAAQRTATMVVVNTHQARIHRSGIGMQQKGHWAGVGAGVYSPLEMRSVLRATAMRDFRRAAVFLCMMPFTTACKTSHC